MNFDWDLNPADFHFFTAFVLGFDFLNSA